MIWFLESELDYSPHCAPSILITFINMVLQKSSHPPENCSTTNMYDGQTAIQHLLVYVAVLCIPWMLLAKPIYIIRYQKKMNYSVSSNYYKSI